MIKVNRRIVFSVIRITALLLIVGCVAKYYDNQCTIYKDKMFDAMEERDQANFESVNLKSQISILEYKLSNNSEDFNNTSEELDAALAEVAWHEERWNILVNQKNNFYTRTTDLSRRSISHYVGDSSTMVYHTSGCDLLDVIDDDDKVSVELTRFSGVQGYTKCSWCLK